MQACYVNTTHPDFLSGHKVGLELYLHQRLSKGMLIPWQAMTIVTDRLNASKPAPVEPKGGKLAPGQINNNKDLDVDLRKEEPSFFGSFFSGTKGAAKKKGAPVMESVSEAQLESST